MSDKKCCVPGCASTQGVPEQRMVEEDGIEIDNIQPVSAKVNSLFSLTETLATLVFHPLYMWIYMSTLNVFPDTVFLISAAFIIPAVVVSLIWSSRKKLHI